MDVSNNTKKKKIQEDEDKSFSEIKGVIIIAIGFLTLFAVYTSWAGVLSTLLQTIFAFVFGCGKYLIPLYIIYMGYRYIIGRGKLKLDKKFAGITLLVFMILLILSTIFIKSIDGVTFGKGFNEMMTKIKNSEFSLNGGIITYIISYLLYKFIGAIGSFIVYSVIFVISAIYAFNVAGGLINNYLAKELGFSEQKLFELAKENTTRMFPLDIRDMGELIGTNSLGMYVITNTTSVNGAVGMLYDDKLSLIAKELNSDLYVIPSSIHEVIAIKADMDVDGIAKMISEVNNNNDVVRKEDVLSNQPYFYNKMFHNISTTKGNNIITETLINSPAKRRKE